jgi:signal transduction histidine kinase
MTAIFLKTFRNSLNKIILTAYTYLQKKFRAFLNVFKSNELMDCKTRIEEQNQEILLLSKELFNKNEEIYTVEQVLNIQWESIEDMQTKLVDAQAKLVHSEKMASLGVLIAGIAHEINNPLNFINTGILGLKENLNELLHLLNMYRELKPETIENELPKLKLLENNINYSELISLIHSLINNIDIGVERTKNIVTGLRTFARSNENDLEVFDIRQNIENTLLILHNKYKNRIIIEKNYGNIPEIEGYSGKISQVFMNILSNAIDAIVDEGRITIQTEYSEITKKIKISIKDTGKGIPNAIIHKIFEPFYTTKQTGEGVGLGLSITYSIIKEHNGDIIVNKNNSEGTEFIITLPLKQ